MHRLARTYLVQRSKQCVRKTERYIMSNTDRRSSARSESRDRRVTVRHTFYSDLESFGSFAGISNMPHYRKAPEDWLIVVADIQGSTKAIDEGRYKDVNMVGAACIMAVLNVTRGFEMPYVFGGDGATMLIPPEALARAREALRKLKNLSHHNFDLLLRVGAVPVSRVRKDNLDVLVAKYQLSPDNFLASFAGGGVTLADRLVKDDDGTEGFIFNDDIMDDLPDLEGLSCRWEPLAAQRGVMLSLLIQSLVTDRDDAANIYQNILAEITEKLGHDFSKCRPVKPQNMKFRWPPKGLKTEAMATRGALSYRRKLLSLYKESFIQWIMDVFKLSAGGFNAPVYRDELHSNSDYLKFDDMIRMVIDCSKEDIVALDAILKKYHEAKHIVYGMHEADSALMTCLLFSLKQSKHVHFIDGSNGGFAIAARQLKQQIRNAAA